MEYLCTILLLKFQLQTNTMIHKKFILTALAGLSLVMPSAAVKVDTDSLGTALNGWRKNRTAYYSINNHAYLTHKPTVTPNPAGGIFVSTRVEHKARFGKKLTSYIELNFSASGSLQSAQIRVMSGDLRLNSGLISRPALKAPPAEGEAETPDLEPWHTYKTKMVADLFTALDTEFAKLSKRDQEEKKDVFSRVFGKGYQTADLSAALRHNANLLLRYTR